MSGEGSKPVEGSNLHISLKGETEFPVVASGIEKKMLAMACIKAPEIKDEQEQRSAVKICAVIDRSGSMRGEKLNMVAQTLEFVVRELSANDQFGIVTYDNSVRQALPMLMMDSGNQLKALSAIRGIRPGGATNLSGGLFEGMREIIRQKPATTTADAKTVSNCVWLFTDGHANEGVTTTEGITTEMDKLLGDDSDMVIHTFGFGSSHNDGMLRSIAEAGNGQYYFIENAAVIKETFAECLGGLLTVVATNLVLKMTPAAGVKPESCLNDLSINLEDLTFKMKDIYSEETRDFVVEFTLPVSEPTPSFPVASVVLVYTSSNGKEQEERIAITIPRKADVEEAKIEVNEGVDIQRNRLETANAMQQAKVEADRGEFEMARITVECAKKKVMESRSCKAERCSDLYEDLDGVEKYMSSSQWNYGKKCVNASEMSHRMQRSCGAKTKYKTAKQACMIASSSVPVMPPTGPAAAVAPAAPSLVPIAVLEAQSTAPMDKKMSNKKKVTLS
eukprot:TRINITY_DN2660_c1_g5_i1.p1 TRINITY_DN2660_c1_g5~~TRINITY_DN2660_c1_g5_i1.p1  ORF type:complete len:526 (+),score=133.33 TRINITY_DN2660_c1_g5_i1:65-1579(+)